MADTDVIILAAGNSTRFGMPKPFLKTISGLTFLEGLVNIYLEFGCRNIIPVLNQNHLEAFSNTFPKLLRSKLKIVYNNKTELGRFYSLKLGADEASNCDYCFIQNIDNPFTDLSTLQKLYENRKPDAYISPVYSDKGGHPVLIPQLIFNMIKKETNNNLNIKELLKQFNKITVSIENDKILANINTPEDYRVYIEQPA